MEIIIGIETLEREEGDMLLQEEGLKESVENLEKAKEMLEEESLKEPVKNLEKVKEMLEEVKESLKKKLEERKEMLEELKKKFEERKKSLKKKLEDGNEMLEKVKEMLEELKESLKKKLEEGKEMLEEEKEMLEELKEKLEEVKEKFEEVKEKFLMGNKEPVSDYSTYLKNVLECAVKRLGMKLVDEKAEVYKMYAKKKDLYRKEVESRRFNRDVGEDDVKKFVALVKYGFYMQAIICYYQIKGWNLPLVRHLMLSVGEAGLRDDELRFLVLLAAEELLGPYPFPESEAPFTYPLVAPLGADFYAQDVTIDKAFGFFTRKWFWPFVIKCAFMGTIFYYLVKFLLISWNVGDEFAADVCVCTTVFCVGFVWFFLRVNCDSKINVEEGVNLRINDEGASNVAPLQET